MALTGNRDTRDIVVKTGVDATELAKFALADGTTYQAVMSLLASGLAGIINEFNAQYGAVYSVSDQPTVTYRMGTNGAFEAFSEYGRPKMQRSETEGHMLPLRAWDRGLGWTWRYLEQAVLEDVQADITAATNATRDLMRVRLLTRLLMRGDDSGTVNGLGSGGYSPGFATTATSTSVDFTPPDYGGATFLSTHEHYTAHAGSGTITTTQTAAMREHLREHGHAEPYIAWISNDDRTVWEALSGFALAGDPNIAQYASTSVVANGQRGAYVGYIHGFQVYVCPGMPNNYCVGFKSYGTLNPMNPLRIRVPKGMSGIDMRVLTDGASPSDPLRDATIFSEFGVGVKDRTAGVPTYSNSGTWSDGTPT